MSSSKVRYVDHTYRDFSRYTEQGGELIKHKKSDANFPAKLHQMLSNPEHSSVITWMPHGRAFKIIDKDILFTQVIPQYYVCKKYESFTRQLNGWGFKRLYQSGPDMGCHYHECFLRGKPELTCLIRRLSPSQGKATPYPAGEPNFYRISEIFPLKSSPDSSAHAKSPGADAETTTLTLDRASPHNEIEYPSSSSKQSSSLRLPGLDSAAPIVPSQGYSQATPNYTSTHDSIAVLAAAASSATPSREHLTQVEYPPYSSIRHLNREHAMGSLSSTTPHESSHGTPQLAQTYRYPPPPSGQSTYSHADSYSPSYPPTYAYSGQQYNTYNEFSTPSRPWQHQHQDQPFEPPQYRYPPPPPPQYRYPPPQLQQHFGHTPTNVAPIRDSLPPGSHPRYQGGDTNTAHSVPSYVDIDARRNEYTKTPERSPMIEPLPYSPTHRVQLLLKGPRMEEEAEGSSLPIRKRKPDPDSRKPDPEVGSPMEKKRKPDPPAS